MIDNIYSSAEFQEITEVNNSKGIHLSLLDASGVSCEAHGIIHNSVAKFGVLAPFWIPSFIEKHSDIKILDEQVSQLLRLSLEVSTSIEIRLPPSFYNSNIEVLKYLLLKNGFTISDVAIWQSIDVGKFQNGEVYEASLKHSARKVLKNFKKSCQGVLQEVDLKNHQMVEEAYNLINQNRKSIGTNLKYSLEYVLKLIQLEPLRIKIFVFQADNTPTAAAICHITSKNILYVAAWGDINTGLAYSPMYNFASSLVQYCIDNSLEYLDYGISSSLDDYNPGLFSFKKNIGCFATSQEKFIYQSEQLRD